MTFSSAIPVLPVSDIDLSARFFTEKLGFDVLYADQRYAVLGVDQIELHLWLASDDTWRNRVADEPVLSGAESFLAGTASCRIRVDEIEPLFEHCQAAAIVHPNGPLSTKWYGMTEFAILDPDRNQVTFFSPAAKS